MQYDNIIVRTVDFLPLTIKGVTIPDYEDIYNIYINAKYSIGEQNRILKHELRHVKNFDFDNFEDIRIIEKRANAV